MSSLLQPLLQEVVVVVVIRNRIAFIGYVEIEMKQLIT